MVFLKNFVIRLLIVSTPLIILYFGAQKAFEANRQKEHPTDAGLGIALLLCFILIILFVALITDLIIRIRKKQYSAAWSNVPFLIIFIFPILYIICQFEGGTFCGWMDGVLGNLM